MSNMSCGGKEPLVGTDGAAQECISSGVIVKLPVVALWLMTFSHRGLDRTEKQDNNSKNAV
jgi:hypothetical protein